MASAVLALKPACVVEIGVWGGRSFLPMAMALKENGTGIAIGIDPWSPQASVIGMTDKDEKWWKDIDHELVYKSYLDWANKLGVKDCIRTIRAKSDDVEPPPTIDVLHIDGNHSEQALKDCQRFGPKVRVGGLCFCDDIGWTGGGVERGLEFLHSIGFVELYRLDTGMMLQRVKA